MTSSILLLLLMILATSSSESKCRRDGLFNITGDNYYEPFMEITEDGRELYQCYSGSLSYSLRDPNGALFWNVLDAVVVCDPLTGKFFEKSRLMDVPKSELDFESLRCREVSCFEGHGLFEYDCESDIECAKPTIEIRKFEVVVVMCKMGYGLQLQYLIQPRAKSDWLDINSVKCTNGTSAVEINGILSTNESHILRFRCVRKKIEKYYNDSYCEPDEQCIMPSEECYPIECEREYLFTLLLRLDETAEWSEVKSARCDSSKFRANLTNGLSIEESSVQLKCARKECTACEISSSVPPDAKFITTKWNQCSKFTCGPYSRMIINDTNVYEKGEVECEFNNASHDPKWTLKDEKSITVNSVACELCRYKTVNFADKIHFYEPFMSPNKDGKHEIYTCYMGAMWIGTKDPNGIMQWTYTTEEIICDPTTGQLKNGRTFDALRCQKRSLNTWIRENFAHMECENGADCSMQPVPECGTGYGLQLQYLTGKREKSAWMDAYSVTPFGENYRAIYPDGTYTPNDSFILRLRCIRKIIKEYYSESYCNSDEECGMPTGDCSSIDCKGPSALLLRTDETEEWSEVQSARCDSSKFLVNLTNGMSIEESSVQLKCAIKKCTFCKRPSSPHPDAHMITTKWNQCSRFTCGIHSRILINNETYEKDDIECEFNHSTNNSMWTLNDAKSIDVNSIACEMCRYKTVNIAEDEQYYEPFMKIADDGKSQIYDCYMGNLHIFMPYKNRKATWRSSLRNFARCDPVTGRLINGYEFSEMRCLKDVRHSWTRPKYSPIECEQGLDCVEPILETTDEEKTTGEAKCNAGYGLQLQYLLGKREKSSWIDVHTVVTAMIPYDKSTLLWFRTNGKFSTNESFILQLRCIRKKIEEYYKDAYCKFDEEKCAKPKDDCALIKCDSTDVPFVLLLRSGNDDTENWLEVQSARCDSSKFRGALTNGMSFEESSVQLKCARKICTLCDSPFTASPEAKIVGATKWDECASFTCGSNSLMIINEHKYENGLLKCSANMVTRNSMWTFKAELSIDENSIACEYNCTLTSPLISSCERDDTHCEEFKEFLNDKPMMCHDKMYFNSLEEAPVVIAKSVCNKANGTWIAHFQNTDSPVVIPTGSNIYCYEGHCDQNRFFPDCEHEDGFICGDYLPDGSDNYICKPPFVFWWRERRDQAWIEMKDIYKLECRAGRIVANGTKYPYDFQAICREPVVKAKAAESKLGLYVGVASMFLILIAVAVAVIVLRATGKGWLHQVILEKIRDNKAKSIAPSPSSKGSKSSAKSVNSPHSSLKSDGLNVNSGGKSRQSSPVVRTPASDRKKRAAVAKQKTFHV